ncbi:thiamine pyrophosphokinase [Amycolatopsis sp. MJM2582]|uniref:Thiamine pyrophosphokinase n=1 Tax=Amycolatopsis keratiniphila subsp. keratiniphila TaxID=227715 RepID=A0A1W2LH76_9PSEU|nr:MULTISPECIES: putative cytokinetic ring protein SteA [Amycolatopsis]KFZ76566.1 thiamine pyrophosphokinase [Amycolatopsis sp. MJM2582]OKK01769.1 thiamine pyrophosphokinase [Amycolatopsis sp. CB00013]OLZ43181.1 thiamine pyrophosphokinase [Amycolatopsis keratiniphila subsp. nogabecina]ONF61962.1 thiamine pyrophosphokinase [Amycolatopsis keratiniphila subsp. keratiniphila]RSN25877.1 thiamine pyrophosphokinase [Amycolatopsis sp. WAC 04169]
MKLTGLLSRNQETLPGITGVARVDRRTRELLRRLSPGDIVVLDQLDLDRSTADALVEAEVAAVVNASPSISGRFPNLGPEILLEAGIPLVDSVGGELLRKVKDGTKLRLHEGVVYIGERQLGSGVQQTRESVADQMIEAKAGMSTQLEAFSANTIEFLRRERSLILDGVGVPEIRVPLRDRHALVVAGGNGHAEDLKKLKKYISEHRPVLIGVDAGADTLRAQGYQPDVIVGDPHGIGAETLRSGGEVVVPAQPDGHAPGVERIQDLGIGAVTFPATGNAEDLALLLADAHEASLVVTVGFQATLREFLDHGRSGSNPSTFLTRLKLGTKLVDGKAVATLHRSRVSIGAIVLLVVATLVAVAAALLVSDVGSVYLDWIRDTWNSFIAWGKGLFT